MDHGVRWMIFVACVNTLLLILWRTVSEVKIKATFACCYDASAKQGRKAAYGENGNICLVCYEYGR